MFPNLVAPILLDDLLDWGTGQIDTTVSLLSSFRKKKKKIDTTVHTNYSGLVAMKT